MTISKRPVNLKVVGRQNTNGRKDAGKMKKTNIRRTEFNVFWLNTKF